MVNKHIRRGRYFCFDFGKISQAKYKQRKTFRLGFNRLELSRRFACFLHTWSTEMSKLTKNMQNKLFSKANDQTRFLSSNLIPFAFTTIFGRFRVSQNNKCFQSLRNGAEVGFAKPRKPGSHGAFLRIGRILMILPLATTPEKGWGKCNSLWKCVHFL